MVEVPRVGLLELLPVHFCFGWFRLWPSALSYKLFKSEAQVTEDIDSGYAEDINGDGFKGCTNTHVVPFILWNSPQNKLSIKPWTFFGLFLEFESLRAQGKLQSKTVFFIIWWWNVIWWNTLFINVSYTVKYLDLSRKVIKSITLAFMHLADDFIKRILANTFISLWLFVGLNP